MTHLPERSLEIRRGCGIVAAAMAVVPSVAASAEWKPRKPVEFIIMAGTGGGADQIARLLQGLIEKKGLSPRPFIPINKPGGSGAEALRYIQDRAGDNHTDPCHAEQLLHDADHPGTIWASTFPSSRRSGGWRSTRSCFGSTRTAKTSPISGPTSKRSRAADGIVESRGYGLWPGRLDPDRDDGEGIRLSRSFTSRSRAVARWPRTSSATTSTRRSTTRPSRTSSCAPETPSRWSSLRPERMAAYPDVPTAKELGPRHRLLHAALDQRPARHGSGSRCLLHGPVQAALRIRRVADLLPRGWPDLRRVGGR